MVIPFLTKLLCDYVTGTSEKIKNSMDSKTKQNNKTCNMGEKVTVKEMIAKMWEFSAQYFVCQVVLSPLNVFLFVLGVLK